jgi:hypothetical protein
MEKTLESKIGTSLIADPFEVSVSFSILISTSLSIKKRKRKPSPHRFPYSFHRESNFKGYLWRGIERMDEEENKRWLTVFTFK